MDLREVVKVVLVILFGIVLILYGWDLIENSNVQEKGTAGAILIFTGVYLLVNKKKE